MEKIIELENELNNLKENYLINILTTIWKNYSKCYNDYVSEEIKDIILELFIINAAKDISTRRENLCAGA